MKIKELEINGVYVLNNFFARDERGCFIKTFNEDSFQECTLNTHIAESYYSISNKGVIRGMHFQLPPYDHHKIVYVTHGRIIDVILDLRKNSPTFRKHIQIALNAFEESIYIPKGCAHGFCSLEHNTAVVYNVGTVYNQTVDSGIKWDSFGMNWQISNPCLSERDKSFVNLDDFNSPF